MITKLLILLLMLSSLVRAGHYEIYILAGQSNAGGHGYVSRAFSLFSPNGDDGLEEIGRSGYQQAQPGVIFKHWRGGNPSAARPVLWDARSDGWIPLRAGYSLYEYNSTAPLVPGNEIRNHPFGAEITFAERMREGRPGRKIAIIKYTQGATSIGTKAAPGAWDPDMGRSYDINSFANAGHCYAGLLQLVQASVAELAQQGHTSEIRGMIWHQGENDSNLGSAYKDRLKEFVTAIRADLGNPGLPFLIGELVQTSSATIRAAQKAAAVELASSVFVSSVALKGDSTSIHFDTLGQLDLGRRYAEQMLRFGPVMRRAIAHWKLDETALPWNGSTYGGIVDSVSSTEGVLYGFSEADATRVNDTFLNRTGPEGGADLAHDLGADSSVGGINTNRPDALPASGDFTLLVKMKTSNTHVAAGHLFSNNNGQPGRAALILTAGSLQWVHHGGLTLTEASAPVFDNEWHQVGIMRRGNDWSLLRDGNIVASGSSDAFIGQDVEWMIGRMRSFGGNYEGEVADVLVYNHAVCDPLHIRQSSFNAAGPCHLAWTSRPGFEYGLEWSPNLRDWSLLGLVTAASGDSTSHYFPDPGNGDRLFVRIR